MPATTWAPRPVHWTFDPAPCASGCTTEGGYSCEERGRGMAIEEQGPPLTTLLKIRTCSQSAGPQGEGGWDLCPSLHSDLTFLLGTQLTCGEVVCLCREDNMSQPLTLLEGAWPWWGSLGRKNRTSFPWMALKDTRSKPGLLAGICTYPTGAWGTLSPVPS